MFSPETKVEYIPQGCDEWTAARILGLAGKVTGKLKFWLNIQDEVQYAKTIDWENSVK